MASSSVGKKLLGSVIGVVVLLVIGGGSCGQPLHQGGSGVSSRAPARHVVQPASASTGVSHSLGQPPSKTPTSPPNPIRGEGNPQGTDTGSSPHKEDRFNCCIGEIASTFERRSITSNDDNSMSPAGLRDYCRAIGFSDHESSTLGGETTHSKSRTGQPGVELSSPGPSKGNPEMFVLPESSTSIASGSVAAHPTTGSVTSSVNSSTCKSDQSGTSAKQPQVISTVSSGQPQAADTSSCGESPTASANRAVLDKMMRERRKETTRELGLDHGGCLVQ